MVGIASDHGKLDEQQLYAIVVDAAPEIGAARILKSELAANVKMQNKPTSSSKSKGFSATKPAILS